MKRISYFFLSLLFLFIIACSREEERLDHFYEVEDIQLPAGLTQEIGGLAFMSDGRLAACFHRGEVMIYDPKTAKWSVFAEGLHDPLGIQVINNHEMLVMQRPELTRLIDQNGDGVADDYVTVTDDYGMSGNYHEFAYGPEPDGKGNYFISLNCGSSGAGIWNELRGQFNPLGRQGRMYSCVPYRGWVMKLDQEGNLTPWACGFRSPNGLGMDLEGNLFVSDNQGDWLGTSKLYHVEKGKFYGHVSSLVWQPGWEVDPVTLPVKTLDTMRTKACVLFPHNIMANSPTQPLCIPKDIQFGPFAGQLLIGDMDFPRIMRVMLEKVKGAYQGACVSFLDSAGLTKGNNRLAFAPDGSLWVGKSAYVWVGDHGIQRIKYQGGTPMDVLQMHVTPTGYDLIFTRPVDENLAKDPAAYQFERYYYEYHEEYGSDRFGLTEVPVNQVTISEDGKKVSLTLADMKPGYVYDLTIQGLKSEQGVELKNNHLFYTLNNLPG